MKPEALQTIIDRANRATIGPWSADAIGSEGYNINVVLPGTMQDRWQTLGFRGCVAEVRAGSDWQCIRHNAEFIAHARTDMVELASEVHRLRDVLEYVQQIAEYREYPADECLDQIERKLYKTLKEV